MLRILWQSKAAYFIAVQSCVLLRAQALLLLMLLMLLRGTSALKTDCLQIPIEVGQGLLLADHLDALLWASFDTITATNALFF